MITKLPDHDSNLTDMNVWVKYGLIFLCVTGFVAYLTWQMMSLAESHCGLCIQFKGQTQCSTAYGPTDSEALDEAHRNACAILASGVTEVLACNRAQRSEIQCGLAGQE